MLNHLLGASVGQMMVTILEEGGRGWKMGAASQVSWIFSQSCLGTKLMLPIFILGLGLVLRYSVVPV